MGWRATNRVTRIALRGTAVAVLVAAAVSGAAPVVGAQEAPTPTVILDRYGWWSKAQAVPSTTPPVTAPTTGPTGVTLLPPQPTPAPAQGNVPTPPTAPSDGLYLASDPQPNDVAGVTSDPAAGPTALGAVRYVVDEGADAVLKLTMNPVQDLPAGASILACQITGGWEAMQNGSYDRRPPYDCNTATTGVVEGDTVTFNLPAYLQHDPGAFDVALIPQSPQQPFQVGFSAPTERSLTITSDPLLDEALATDDVPTDDSSYADLTADSGTFTGVDDLSATSYADSFVPSAASTATPHARPPVRRRPQLAVPAGALRNPFRKDAGRGERLMAVSLLLLIAGALWWVGGAPARPPRLLGSLAGAPSAPVDDVRMGGVGRFSRPRPPGRPPRRY
jgi:hypothetical protein